MASVFFNQTRIIPYQNVTKLKHVKTMPCNDHSRNPKPPVGAGPCMLMSEKVALTVPEGWSKTWQKVCGKPPESIPKIGKNPDRIPTSPKWFVQDSGLRSPQSFPILQIAQTRVIRVDLFLISSKKWSGSFVFFLVDIPGYQTNLSFHVLKHGLTYHYQPSQP